MSQSSITTEQIKANIDAVPRIAWSHTPTPLEEWKELRRVLGGPRILVKRDDTTGLAYGGNKSRHFEFEMARVKNQGFDTVMYGNRHRLDRALALRHEQEKWQAEHRKPDRHHRPDDAYMFGIALIQAEGRRVALHKTEQRK